MSCYCMYKLLWKSTCNFILLCITHVDFKPMFFLPSCFEHLHHFSPAPSVFSGPIGLLRYHWNHFGDH